MTNGISQCPKCGGAIFHTVETVSSNAANVHVCDPGETEIMAHMNREKARQEAKDAILTSAHNAMVWWANLKCDEGHLRLPIKFVIGMEELDRDVERLQQFTREDNAKALSKESHE